MQYPGFDPIALQLGPVAIRWYGLMYLIGFVVAWMLMRRRAARSDSVIPVDKVDDLLFYGALGVILGGRVGYGAVLQLRPTSSADPLMSVPHLGRRHVLPRRLPRRVARGLLVVWPQDSACGFWTTHAISSRRWPVTIGLGAGRIGNYINGELWGKTDRSGVGFPGQLPGFPFLAAVFRAAEPAARHAVDPAAAPFATV